MASIKDRIIKKLREFGHDWEWLSYETGHIRVHEFGDIWLTKGTYKIEGQEKYKKRDIPNLLTLLSKKNPPIKEIGLEERIVSLEELITVLQYEIDQLKMDVRRML